MKGCLFFDVDGTLVDSASGKLVPEDSVIDAIHQAQQNGYLCFISTGRNYGGISELLDLGFDGYVFSDGGGIKQSGKDSILTPIPNDVLKHWYEQVKRYKAEVMLSCEHELFASAGQYQEIIDTVHKSTEDSNEEEQKLLAAWNMRPIHEYDGSPVIACDMSFQNEEIELQWLKEKSDQLDYVCTTASYGRGGATTGELTYKGVNKGQGCLRMMEMYGCDLNQSYAFGDSMNDASMFNVCAHSIAMGNGAEELKAIAEYVTDDINQNGLVNAMKKYKIIKGVQNDR